MPTITKAYKKRGDKFIIVGIEEALADPGGIYHCPECRMPVRPHKAGENGHTAAHFEHKKRNRDCPLSYQEEYDRPKSR